MEKEESRRIVPELTTLCYLERDHQYLMLHRTKKQHDVNHDKWIGVGGHVENEESPEDCLLREVREETGLVLTSYRMRGVVTFLSGKGDYEYMFLYTADGWTRADGSTKWGEEAAEAKKSQRKAAADERKPDVPDTDLPVCDEGVLEWVDLAKIENLNIWEGDKIFFRLIDQNAPFFSLKLVYDGKDHLIEAVLDGKPMTLPGRDRD